MKTRGFTGRSGRNDDDRIPPGQYQTDDFPVLSTGPTPPVRLDQWMFSIMYANEVLAEWNWQEFRRLPQAVFNVDIHCVTKWTKLDTNWEGVSIDTLLEAAGIEPPTEFVMAYGEGDYTTNLPLEDLINNRAMIAMRFAGEALAAVHGGPARLLVPHRYFWKSAKWVKSLRFIDSNEPGFWERGGYHMYGDPWTEQRYR